MIRGEAWGWQGRAMGGKKVQGEFTFSVPQVKLSSFVVDVVAVDECEM